MRTLSHLAAAALTFAAPAALAQTTADGVPIIIPSQSSIYNQNAVNLPAPPMPNGQDVVRGVSGASCQSSVGSGGPYLDLGVIGSQDVFNRETAALYGRVVIPIGERPKRVDCTRLYELEIARLKMEIDLMRLGMPVSRQASMERIDGDPLEQHHEPSPRQAARESSVYDRLETISVKPRD
ncbi:MAG: hypothetical protein VX640_00850 [Pseudomonadota bacterium]|nr:hypothetical protein [Pseudomonadota bacterium]